VGLANFTSTFTDPEFWLSLRNTLLLALVVVPATLVVGTVVGLLLNRLGKKMAAFVSTAALMAWATPPISAAVLFYWLVSPDGGIVDWTLSKMPHWLVGSTNWAQYNWTTNGALQAYVVIAVLVVWQSFPFIAVSVLAGLKTIPSELLEAARVDGASPSRVFWKITYPLLKPIFLVLLLLSVIWDFNIFAQSYIVTGFPGNQNEYNLSTYLYDKAFASFPPSYGLGGAIALIFALILLVVTIGYVRTSVRQGALT
jgi:N,N'-diacetylchitobiose transport system permease protein